MTVKAHPRILFIIPNQKIHIKSRDASCHNFPQKQRKRNAETSPKEKRYPLSCDTAFYLDSESPKSSCAQTGNLFFRYNRRISGALREIRTPDTRFRRPVLYPLSYKRMNNEIIISRAPPFLNRRIHPSSAIRHPLTVPSVSNANHAQSTVHGPRLYG